MGYLEWTDGDGSATLTNGKPKPARRFTSWTPDVVRIVDRRTALGTGKFYEFLYRQDYTAKFRIDHIPASQQATFLRFKEFAMQGCAFYVKTEDIEERAHLCRVRPDTDITFELSNSQTLEYSLSMEVMSATEPPNPLECIYRA
jgi:hypothetical protein